MKNCPFCKEQIQDDAIKCRYCGEFLTRNIQTPTRRSIPANLSTPFPPNPPRQIIIIGSILKWAGLIFLALVLIGMFKELPILAIILLMVLIVYVFKAMKNNKHKNTFKFWGPIAYSFAVLIMSLIQAGNKYAQVKQTQEAAERYRQDTVKNYENIKDTGIKLAQGGKIEGAMSAFNRLLEVRPDDVEIQRLKQKTNAVMKAREDAAKLRQETKTRQLEAAKKAINGLAEEYASGLPSPVGQLVFVDAKIGAMPIERAFPVHNIKWLNSEKTKAKVVVTLRGMYTRHISPLGRVISDTQDYHGGSFICDSDSNGNWSITSRE